MLTGAVGCMTILPEGTAREDSNTGHTSNSMPVSTSTPLRGSCSIQTLVNYLAYLLWLDHTTVNS